MTRTTWQSAVSGGGWTVIGLGWLVAYLHRVGHVAFLLGGIWFLVFGGIYLASAVARHRREHSRNDSHTVD